MPCFTAMRAEIALMSGSAFAVTHHAFSSGARGGQEFLLPAH
ncbi:transposase [Shigella boydii CDC 3083-94]|uniref:Transposase n=1 Tax=Shigella boydii serotype 18 (strain CDC 3083-94 / BS512) TaxID=344609 RepID=B2TX06_SHIB3|nr:transposase [Shigella boydii CDC 3083-94]